MKRALLFVGFALAITVATAILFTWRPAAPSSGRAALPSFEFADADGRAHSIESFAGKVVLLDFWASWCAPCRNEMPQFERLQERWGARGLVVVPVSIDAQGLAAVEAFYTEQNLTHLAKFIDPSREAAKKIGFVGIPSALLIDRQGREAARIEGPINWESGRIAALIEKLLSEQR